MKTLPRPLALRACWTTMAMLVGLQCGESRVPSNEDMESIAEFRSQGHFSDKNSDFLATGRRWARTRTSRTRQRLLAAEEEEVVRESLLAPDYDGEQMLGDDPYASGQIFSFGGFSQEAVVPPQRDRYEVPKQLSSMEKSYRRKPYIQLFNKQTNMQMEVRTGGSVRVTNDIITRNSVFLLSFHTTRNGLRGVMFQNVASCSYLCLNSSGRVYSRPVCSDSSSKSALCQPQDCLFNTGRYIKDVSHQHKLASVRHRNSSQQFYLSLDDHRLRGQWIPDSSLRQFSRQPKQDWIFLKTSFRDLEKVFKDKVAHVYNARVLNKKFCPAVLESRARKEARRERRRKAAKDCWKEKKNRRKCFAKEEKACAKLRQTLPTSDPRLKQPCSQSERDEMFGRGWRWNTRNCESLDGKERRKCKRAKRKRCVKREGRKDKALSDLEAQKTCKRKERKRAKGKI